MHGEWKSAFQKRFQKAASDRGHGANGILIQHDQQNKNSSKQYMDNTHIEQDDQDVIKSYTVDMLLEHKDEMDSIFEHDEELGYITIKAAYPYHIELERIPDMEGLVQWIHHLSEKSWMTSVIINEFINRVCKIKGWNIYRRNF